MGNFFQVHPKEPIFAVAEKGDEPIIFLYVWPELNILSCLRHGTAKQYSCIAFR